MTSSQRLHERCACAGARPSFALAGTDRKYERSRPFRIQHLFVDLKLDFADKSVRGRAVLDFERASALAAELELDAVGFELEAVQLDAGGGSRPARHEYDGEKLRLLGLPERGQLLIDYYAKPRRGLYFLAPDEHVRERPVQAWTQCQDEDARHFIPCLDKPHIKMTTELCATVPAGFQVLSNGELVSAKTRGKEPWSYRFKLEQPHPSYLLTLVAGQFDVVDDRPAQLADREVPVRYLVPLGQAEHVARSLGQTPRMLELFSRLFGVPYPWPRYTQVVVSDFIFGGMENTTATTLYEHVMLDERAALDVSSNDLVAHELGHQWFGDYVTCRDWSQAWLNEGFATFCEHLEREDRLGRDEYDYGIAGDLDTYLAEAASRYQRPLVCRDYAEPIDLFDRHLYEKGGLALHMLRRELTDPIFFEGVRRYLTRHAFGLVETTDLLRSLEEVSGRSLERFADQWLYRPGHPELNVKITYEDGLLSVSVKQTQKTGETATFALPIEIEVADRQGRVNRHRKLMTETHDALLVELDERPAHVGFDPELRLAAALTLEAPEDMLRSQLASGTSALLRWQAAEALAGKSQPPAVRALAEALLDEEQAWMVRFEAARALSKTRGEDAFSALSKASATAHPKVRRAVAIALGNFRNPEAAELLARLLETDPSYLVAAEAARALGKTRQDSALQKLERAVDRPSWADVVRAGALDGMAALRDDTALDIVRERTRYGVPTRGRRAAVHALAALGEGKRTRERLEELLDDRDPHFKIDVVSALTELGDHKSRGALRSALEREHDGRVLRRLREALRDLGDSATSERKRWNDELETVRSELVELKARLAKLESRKTKDAEKLPSPEGAARPSQRAGKSPSDDGAAPRPAARSQAKVASKKSSSSARVTAKVPSAREPGASKQAPEKRLRRR
jgi:aminopeptidase N